MKFRALHNPNFNLTSAQLGHPIQFQDGEYETDDLGEIKVLQRHSAVEELHVGGVVPGAKPTVEQVTELAEKSGKTGKKQPGAGRGTSRIIDGKDSPRGAGARVDLPAWRGASKPESGKRDVKYEVAEGNE